MCSTSLSGDAVCLPGKKDGSEGSGSDSPVEEITGEMEGNLVIWNRMHRCIRLDLSSQKETAGALFIRLAEHIPFAFLGATPWMQVENEQDFQEMVRMVDLYQEIHGGTCL